MFSFLLALLCSLLFLTKYINMIIIKKYIIVGQMNNTNININDLIQNEVNRISLKYGKDFLDCED